MSAVRGWALAICMACIVVGILQRLCAEEKRFSVIKLILTLYILITAFAPLQSLRYARVDIHLPVAANVQDVSMDTNAAMMQTGRQSLEQTIKVKCEEAGISVSGVSVALTDAKGSVEVKSVDVTILKEAGANEDAVRRAVSELLGVDTQIAVQIQ